jgi:hypothetical protein
LKAVSMIVTAASSNAKLRHALAKSLLKSMCMSKVHVKLVKSAFKQIKILIILEEPVYVLAVLQNSCT